MESIHIAPGNVFEIGHFAITNTMLSAIVVLFAFIGIALKFSFGKKKSRFKTLMKMIVGGLFGIFDGVIENKEKTKKYFPILATIFLFVLFSNWLGLFLGMGESIYVIHEVHGKHIHVPIFRGSTSDINLTFAIALFAVLAIQFFGVKELKFSYFKKFFNPANLFKPAKWPELFVGLIEIISEFAKILSFGFRLFGNIFAGEVVLLVMTELTKVGIPAIFYGLEIFVGFIQAFVFALLTSVFIKIATTPHEHEESENSYEKKNVSDHSFSEKVPLEIEKA